VGMFVVLGSIVLTSHPSGSRRVLEGRGTRFRGEVRWGSGMGPPASGCCLAEGVVAARDRLQKPFAVGLADCHVVMVGAVLSVVATSLVVLGLTEATASSAISLEL
jgi:hypothetical protein